VSGAARIELGTARVLRPGRWLWLRATAWLLLLFFATGLAFGLPLQWAADRLPGTVGWQVAGIVGACASALAVYVLAVRSGEGRWPRELALRPAVCDLTAGVLLGLVMMAALMGSLVAAGLYEVSVGTGSVVTGLGLALQAAVTEELWTRALVFRLVWRAFGPLPAFAVSALLFAALHLSNPGATVVSVATVAAAGLMFCGLYAVTGRLWVPIGVHAAWNFTQGSLFGATVSGGDLGGSLLVSAPAEGARGWLTGGDFGPEASVVALVLIGSVAAVTIRASRRGAVRDEPQRHETDAPTPRGPTLTVPQTTAAHERTTTWVARTSAVLLLAVVAFQLAVTLGAPWGAWTQGGRTAGTLTTSGRAIAAASALLLVGMALTILGRAGEGPLARAPRRLVAVLSWATVGYLAIGVAANLATPSVQERALWAPVVALTLGLALTTLVRSRRDERLPATRSPVT